MIRITLALVLAVTALAAGEFTEARLKELRMKRGDWTAIIGVPVPPQNGQPQPDKPAAIWLPEGVDKIRGLYFPGHVIIDKKSATDGAVRAALAELKMGILYYHMGGGFIHGGGEHLEGILGRLAEKTGHPEVEFAPMLTSGHSAAGLFCRNIGYWKPHRTIGVIMIKSGNFHHALEDMDASLKGVPLIHFSGEFEEYGPEGGDLGAGLRSAYVTEPTEGPRKRKNQTQWVMTRMQMLERRRKHEDNLWSLVVHRGGSHTRWGKDMNALMITYIRELAKVRIPPGDPPSDQEVHCLPLTAKDGWLYDADIKNPRHEPAPYADYAGNREQAFWAPTEAMAKAIWDYHQAEPWSHPDPTAGKPDEERFVPPPILRDFIDAPPPPAQHWQGGDGAWTKAGEGWTVDGTSAAFDPAKQAVFDGPGGIITVPENIGATGLTLGKGYVLDLGTQRVGSRWHGTLAEGSEVRVTLDRKSSGQRGKRGSSITIDGNATVGCKVVVTIEEGLVVGRREGLRPDDYAVIKVKGRRTGDVVAELPEHCTGRWYGNTWCVVVEKVLTEKELEAKKKREESEANEGVFDLEPKEKEVDPEAPVAPRLGL